jgi:serine palmitoyltransferase
MFLAHIPSHHHPTTRCPTTTLPTRSPTAGSRTCINLGSYNYLGFADDWHETCRPRVMDTAASMPLSVCAAPAEGGYTALHAELEALVAEFVGKEAAVVFNMGFATNALGVPCLGGKGTLLISDSLNHSSIVTGARASGAVIRVYKHTDYRGLESLLRTSIVEGQDRTHRPWRKIVVMVEGIYSMEGEMVDLSAVVALAKRYKAYVYLDEAHSIGALGKSGRGLCEQKGVSPGDVDILMGTFTKSFGAMGGYIAGSAEFVEAVRAQSAGFLTDNTMSPVVVQQILTSFRVLRGDDGTGVGAEKLRRLRENSNYMRQGLIDMGCEVFGEWDSPVIPVMVYNPTKIGAFSRECLARGVRMRGCVSCVCDRPPPPPRPPAPRAP